MREVSAHQARSEQRALIVAIAWMLLVQVACVVLWDQGFLARQVALIHWLIVGVLPPALALWTMRSPAAARRPH